MRRTPLVHRAVRGHVHASTEAAGSNADAAPGLARLTQGGQPLPPAVRSYFEPRFGYDFSQVRVQTSRLAETSAASLNARAFTMGNVISFAAGNYAPQTPVGAELLAHELTHVVQQSGVAPGVVQRAEVDDRSCAGLTDIESDIDTKVNAEIAAARTAVGTPIPVIPLVIEVHSRLGQGDVTPIEHFIEAMPATKRNLPPRNLAGTKYSGVGAANRFYHLQTLGLGNVVGSAAKVHGICIGADKLGHFFGEGAIYLRVAAGAAGPTTDVDEVGRGLEAGFQGLESTGVYSNADQAANKAGLKFYNDLMGDPSGLTFKVSNYITSQWNEQTNPSFYDAPEAKVIWSNLLAGQWQGPFTSAAGKWPRIVSSVFLNATTSGAVTGSYSWTAGTTWPGGFGTITNGTITHRTTAVSGLIPPSLVLPGFTGGAKSASPVSGISIEFDWVEAGWSGKGKWDSVNEQTFTGTWGFGSSRTNGGAWDLNK